jgi:fido (protein-threonine AMPylation protein)
MRLQTTHPLTLHPQDCPRWQYENHPNFRSLLKNRVADLTIRLMRGVVDTKGMLADDKPIHGFLFEGTTPDGHGYYAGHYRGEDFRCLKYCQVGIPGNPFVGARPWEVGGRMKELRGLIDATLQGLDRGNALPSAQLSDKEKVKYTVTAACKVFDLFNRIHPYVNGNGHISRVCLWAILGRYGLWPKTFPIDPRPPDPPYSSLVRQYQDGFPDGLESFVLKSVCGL